MVIDALIAVGQDIRRKLIRIKSKIRIEMYIIWKSILFTGCAFMANVICRETHNWRRYLAIFFLILSFLYFTQASASVDFPIIKMQLDEDQIDEYMDRCDYHHQKAMQALWMAQDLVWYLPQTTDREKAEYCFTTLLTTFSAPTPWSKIAAACIAFLSKYGLSCMDEWEKIQTYLYEAKHHFELEEFYEDVLIKG